MRRGGVVCRVDDRGGESKENKKKRLEAHHEGRGLQTSTGVLPDVA